MELNIDIPKDKGHLLDALLEESRRTGRPVNDLILGAIEQHLMTSRVPTYRTYPLAAGSWVRADLYEDRLG